MQAHAHARCRGLPRPRHDAAQRRQLLVGIALTSMLQSPAAHADVLEGIAKQLTRPEGVSSLQAVVQLIDAAATLRDIQACCCTPLFWTMPVPRTSEHTLASKICATALPCHSNDLACLALQIHNNCICRPCRTPRWTAKSASKLVLRCLPWPSGCGTSGLLSPKSWK